MILCTIVYPSRPGARFDFTYYIESHIPWVAGLLAQRPGFQGLSVERGTTGVAPRPQPAFIALCHFKFDTVDNYLAAFSPHADAVRADIPKYTDITPLVQFSQVLVTR